MEADTQVIGGYRVISLLGTGGMGEVYLVEHPRLPRCDALKLLDAAVSRNQQFRSRFKREADLLAALQHPNIITVYDRGEHEGQLWLAMEYVDGQDAAKLIRNRGALTPETAFQIVDGAGAALDYAYVEHGITHRDVKPANILVAYGQSEQITTVKLADFGIAKAAGESTTLTSTGITIGTMSYIAPEAIEGRELDSRADVYSLGCTAFELLTGTLPYPATTIPALMMAHLTGPIPSITARNPRLPAHLDDVFAKVLAKNPDERFDTCERFVAALRAQPTQPWPNAGDTLPAACAPTVHAAYAAAAAPDPELAVPYPDTAPTPAAAPQRRPSRRPLTVSAVAVAVVIAIGIATFLLRNPPSQNAAQQPMAPAGTLAPPPSMTAPAQVTYGEQVELPFTGLVGGPAGVAVDLPGNVYVVNTFRNAVLKLPVGADTAVALPFDGLSMPEGVAVDGAGDVYVADTLNQRVLKLPQGTANAAVLPIEGLGFANGVAVDISARNVYVAAHEPSRVLRLPAGADSASVLPFSGLNEPVKVAVDDSDDVYVVDKLGERVLKLRGDGTQIELPFTGLVWPEGIAVNGGDVYVVDSLNNRVLKLARGDTVPVALPFTGLKSPKGVAVDLMGNVYVTDSPSVDEGRVVKLSAHRPR